MGVTRRVATWDRDRVMMGGGLANGNESSLRMLDNTSSSSSTSSL